MKSNGTRIAAALGAVVVVVVLFFVFKGDDGSDDATTASVATTSTTSESNAGGGDKPEVPNAPEVPTINVVGGEPEGGVADLTFDKGDQIRFVVMSDTADEVHVHGYDIEEEVPAGGSAEFDFPADSDGIYEVELHSSETQIAELTVNP